MKNEPNIPWTARHDLDSNGFVQEDLKLRKDGLRPGCISGYKGSDGKTRFAAIWFGKGPGLIAPGTR